MTAFKIKLLASAMTALCFLPTLGQETIVLKNGSRLYGHTSGENFENWTVTFMTDSVNIVERLDNVIYNAPYEMKLYELTGNNWRRWFDAHPEYTFSRNGQKSAHIGSIEYINRDSLNFGGQAIIRELGPDYVMFFAPHMLTIGINKNRLIDHYEYATRAPLALVGTETEIVPVNGTSIKGQIVADYPDRLILLTSDGVRHVIPYNNIRIKRTLPYNTNRPLAEQMKYLSRITHRNKVTGKNETLNGVIIREIVYRPLNNEPPYYEIVNPDGLNPIKLSFDNVLALRLSPNSQYVEELDVVINNDDDLLIEGITATKTPYTLKSDRYEFTDVSQSIHVNHANLDNGNLKVSYKDLPLNNDFIFVQVNADNNNNNSNRNDSGTTYYTLLSNMVLSSYTATDRFVSPNMNVSVNYGPVQPGTAYMIMRRSDPAKSVYLIFVD